MTEAATRAAPIMAALATSMATVERPGRRAQIAAAARKAGGSRAGAMTAGAMSMASAERLGRRARTAAGTRTTAAAATIPAATSDRDRRAASPARLVPRPAALTARPIAESARKATAGAPRRWPISCPPISAPSSPALTRS